MAHDGSTAVYSLHEKTCLNHKKACHQQCHATGQGNFPPPAGRQPTAPHRARIRQPLPAIGGRRALGASHRRASTWLPAHSSSTPPPRRPCWISATSQRRLGSPPSTVVSRRGRSSVSTIFGSPFFWGITTGTISCLKRPESMAAVPLRGYAQRRRLVFRELGADVPQRYSLLSHPFSQFRAWLSFWGSDTASRAQCRMQ